MRVPVQIMVGGQAIKIEYKEALKGDDGEALSGECLVGEPTIRLSKAKHANERAVFHTLFHELIHKALERTGHSVLWKDEQEEPLVYALENMLAELFVFSPEAPVKWKELDWPED